MKEAIKVLEKYKCLQECVLKDIKWKDYCTNVDFIFDNIWSSTGEIRQNLDQEQLIVLKFRSVQEFHFLGNLSKDNILNPELINWGLNEISIIQIIEDSSLLEKYNSTKLRFFHVRVLWENERKIDLVFKHLKIMQQV